MSKSNNNRKTRRKPVREQPRKDSRDKRVNFDNTRESKFIRDVSKDIADDHNNDVSWYTHNPEMLKAAGNYGFSYLTGEQLPFQPMQGNNNWGTFVPGIMAFEWLPSFGGVDADVINKAADQIHNYVVHANSRNTRYSAADLFITLIATSECFSMVSAMIRAFGCMNNFSDRNDYTPKALVLAMGFDYDDLQANLSNMWFDINHMIADLGQLWLPKDMPFVARHFWMNANVYTDSQTAKAQYYLYVQSRFFKYQDIQFETGTSLSPVDIITGVDSSGKPVYSPFNPGPSIYSWEEWKTVFYSMVKALIQAEDRGTMLGDVLKAYGRENLYSIAEVPVNYRIMYVYSSEVLTQFENLISNPVMTSLLGLKQQKSTNLLVPYYYGNGDGVQANVVTATPNQAVLNFHQMETPSAEQIMIATRMMPSAPAFAQVECVTKQTYQPNYDDPEPLVTTKYSKVLPRFTGTEVCTAIPVYGFNFDDNGQKQIYRYAMDMHLAGVTTAGSSTTMRFLYLWSAFDWAPWYYAHTTSAAAAGKPVVAADGECSNPISAAFGDWDNYTILTTNELRKLHTAAIYSEYGVPMF